MFVKKVFNKLYLKIIFFSLIFFISINSSAISAVLTEEELKYIEEQSTESNDDEGGEDYIKYEDIKEKKTKKKPFIFFGSKKKKLKKKVEKKETLKKEKKSEKLKIGVLLPLTGKYSYIGQSFLDTMQMVVYENKSIDSELIIKDTKANPSLAKKATKELVEQNVDIILGPFFSSSLNASLKIAKYKNIPLISFSSDKKQKEEGVYLMGFEPETQITNITDYTIKKKL